jgi:TonB family protein
MKLRVPVITYLMNHQNSLRFLLCLLLMATTAAFAAESHKVASPLPKDPAVLLALAEQHNGLSGPGLKPWHIQATYQLYDAKGKPTEQGAFEEWWEGPNKYKISFYRPSYHIEIVANAKGTYVSGNAELPYPEYLVQRLFTSPVSTKLPAKGMHFNFNKEKFGKMTLDCVEEIPKGLHPTGIHRINLAFPTYCVNTITPMLRIYGSYGQSLAQLVNVGSLEGRYLPMNAVIYNNGIKLLNIHLVKGESAAQWSRALFTPPKGASLETTLPDTLFESAKVLAGHKIAGQDPVYPESAKENHEQGTVSLAAIITKNGRIRSLIVTSAPAMSLADSALVAVKTWKYKPYLLNGRPVNVQTTIQVIYTLGY